MLDRKKFLTNTDETGRFIVVSFRTGKQYFVEPICTKKHMADWGSFNPSSGKIENKKGAGKYTGAILEEESMITKENGFNDIHVTQPGEGPFWEIEKRDAKYKDGEFFKKGN